MAKHLLRLRKRRVYQQRSPTGGTWRSIRHWPGPLHSVPALPFPANPVRPAARLVLSTACSLQVRVSKRVSGRPTLCVCGQLSPLNAKIRWSISTASRSPRYWDPLVRLTYRRQLGRKWRIIIHGDGGGFVVGSDVDVTATARAEWQFARHFGIAMGYGGMHLSDSNTVGGKTLKISPTLHGPTFGLG